MSECYLEVADDDRVDCDNCEWTGVGADLDMIADIQMRISPGCEVPAGQCPDCGALAYLTNPPKLSNAYRARRCNELEVAMVGLLADIADHWDGDERDLDVAAEDIAKTFDLTADVAEHRKG